MKYFLSFIFLIMTVLLPLDGFAATTDPITEVLELLINIEGYQNQIAGFQNDIDSMTKNIQGYMSGNYGWGKFNFQDFQSYGTGGQNWGSVLQMAQNGGSSGALGQSVNQLSSQFPINTALVNHVVSDPTLQAYYALQAQTALASRAASQLDYNKIQDQINYQQMLQQQIENTTDVKAAIDLQNRLQVENNLIQLEVLRQVSLLNQQKSIDSQSEVNNMIANSNFLNH